MLSFNSLFFNLRNKEKISAIVKIVNGVSKRCPWRSDRTRAYEGNS
jgi:hypothetical protein